MRGKKLPFRCRLNMAQKRQSQPDSGLRVQVKALEISKALINFQAQIGRETPKYMSGDENEAGKCSAESKGCAAQDATGLFSQGCPR